MQPRFGGVPRRIFLRPRLGALLAIEHVGARHVVLARAHQRQLHLVLDVLDVEGAALRLAAHQRADHGMGQPGHQLADARRGRALAAVHRQERLRHRYRDLARLEPDHGAVAPDDLVLGVRAAPRRGRLGDARQRPLGCRRGFLCDLHVSFPCLLRFEEVLQQDHNI